MYSNFNNTDLLERYKFFKEIFDRPDWHGQKFAGGWVLASTKFLKWVASLDFDSLYPSVTQWANIGADTLIEPKDLPNDLFEIRSKYFTYYPEYEAPADLAKYDEKFIETVLRKPEVIEEIRTVLLRHNVCATPNGMFFRKDKPSVMSTIIDGLISNRKVYKGQMKATEKTMEELKVLIEDVADPIKKKELEDELQTLSQDRDLYDVRQMALKILNNSVYGSYSLEMNAFAGQSEYFSTAITSGARVANMFCAQNNSMKIDEIIGEEVGLYKD